jgi:hypothetical protein
MSDYAFGLKTPVDFLEKARREVRRLKRGMAEASLASPVDIQDVAINAALTLWHVADWIAKYPDDRYRAAIERIRQESGSKKTKLREIIHEYGLMDRIWRSARRSQTARSTSSYTIYLASIPRGS